MWPSACALLLRLKWAYLRGMTMDERAGGENDLAVGDVASDFDH